MNALQRFLNRLKPDKPSGERILLLGRTQAGQHVTEETALKYGAVWACVSVISKAIAILPWCVYQKTRTGQKEDTSHGMYWLLHNQPNPEMSPYQFKHLLMSHVLTWGNAYCEIERDNMNRPLWLWPITPDRVTPDRDETGALFYRVRNSGAAQSELDPADVLHLRGLGFDGLVGYSPIRYAAETIGLGMATEQFGSSFFGNGASPSLVLMHPRSLSDEAIQNLEKSVQRRTGGRNAHRPFVAEEGMKVEKLSVAPEEAQFIQSRNVTVLDICRWYGVPPHKLAALDRATFNNIEHQEIEFVTDTIQPWVTQLEEEVNLKCFGRQQRGVYYTKLNMAALLRGDLKTRYEAYQIGHTNGWLSANDIRALEDMNPITNGNMYLVPANMTTRERMKSGDIGASSGNQLPGDTAEPTEDPQTAFRNSLKARAKRVNGSGHA